MNLRHLPILWNSLRHKRKREIAGDICESLKQWRFLTKNRPFFADFLWILVQNAPLRPVRTRICRSKSFLSSHFQRNRYAFGL
ncbi:hypothetical protein CO674_11225 [Rhizobium hidalgonense]|uniref:Uncharacterized protein n=1 Tax=Rhizobium hidalgonense TaxID=1538159 RepID=A0ABX4JUS5_9HYPH|nr:hypothetical protein CO674_11225 [Rhizobium hidalgonense]